MDTSCGWYSLTPAEVIRTNLEPFKIVKNLRDAKPVPSTEKSFDIGFSFIFENLSLCLPLITSSRLEHHIIYFSLTFRPIPNTLTLLNLAGVAH